MKGVNNMLLIKIRAINNSQEALQIQAKSPVKVLNFRGIVAYLILLYLTFIPSSASAEGYNINEYFKLSGSAELDYIYMNDHNDKSDSNTYYLDRGLLLNLTGSKNIDDDMKLGYFISQKIISGAPKDERNYFGNREAYMFMSSNTYGTLKGGRLFSNSFLVLDWPYGMLGHWFVNEIGIGKVTARPFYPTAVSYDSPVIGKIFSFKAQHGWDNKNHNRDNLFDLLASINIAKNSFINIGYLSSNVVKEMPEQIVGQFDPNTKVVTIKILKETKHYKDEQAYAGTVLQLCEPLTLRVLGQVYKRRDQDLSVTVNKGKEYTLGAKYTMGNYGYLNANFTDQRNTDRKGNFTERALQYGHAIGKSAEWYFRVSQKNPAEGERTDRLLTGIYISF